MTILVKNCFHWMSFHIVNELLYAGYRVHGHSKTKNKHGENFLMYLARNSNFKYLTSLEQRNYKAVIIIDENVPSCQIKNNRIFWITPNQKPPNNSLIKINIPPVFGEWMPMDMEQMYIEGVAVSFQSATFLEEAIDIQSLSLALIQWLKSTYIRKEMNIKSIRSHRENLMLENIIYLRDNRSIYNRLNEVKNHYKKSKNYMIELN